MESWYSRETLLKLFGRLHHESLRNEDLATKNLLNLLDDFETKSLQDKKDDMRKLYESLDARSKQEVKERYGRSLHYKRTVNAAAPKLIPRTLDMLPAEMLMQICDFADPKSLITLRRTCRIISQCAMTPFCNVHFSERRHILSRHSLLELVKITAHPVFGPFVRTIKLGSCRLSADAFLDLDLTEDECHRGDSMALKQAKDDIYLTVSEQGNLDYGHSRFALLWLIQALDNIHGWGNEPTLVAWVDVSNDSSAANDPTYFRISDSESATFWGSLKAYRAGIDAATAQNPLTFEDRPYATIKLLLRAAHVSNCTVERFGLSIRASEYSTRYPPFAADDIRTQLSSLQSLTINACPRVPGTDTELTTMRFVESLIKRTLNLTECKFSGIRITPGRTELVPSIGNIALHTLHLSDFATNGFVLFEILNKQLSTLKHLSLKSLRFDSGSIDMEALFYWMKRNLPLNALDVSNLRVDRSREEISLPLSKKQVAYTGTEQVREGLEELLEMLQDPKMFLARPSPPQQVTPNSSTVQQTPLPRPVAVLTPPLASTSTLAPTPVPNITPAPAIAPTSAMRALALTPVLASVSASAMAPALAAATPDIPLMTAAPSRKRKRNSNIGDPPRFESRQGA